MPKKPSQTGASDTASDPVTDEPGKDNAPATPQTEDKPKATRMYRGIECEITKSTKDVVTGAEYDLILVPRKVTNRRTNEVEEVLLGKKRRRPGTGTTPESTEVDITEVEL